MRVRVRPLETVCVGVSEGVGEPERVPERDGLRVRLCERDGLRVAVGIWLGVRVGARPTETVCVSDAVSKEVGLGVTEPLAACEAEEDAVPVRVPREDGSTALGDGVGDDVLGD